MTIASCIAQARRLSRTSTTGQSDADALEWVDESQKQFAEDVHGLEKEDYLVATPKFDFQTHFAIRLTVVGGTNELSAVDIPICTTDALDRTGAQAATLLQAVIRAAGPTTLTVAWSTTTWKFTIDTIDGTSITLAEPSDTGQYVNALDLLGLEAETTVDTSVTGNVPDGCTVEFDLPDDFLSILPEPEWDGCRLSEAPYDLFLSPPSMGIPYNYSIAEKKLRTAPAPSRQGMLHIRYKYMPSTSEETDLAIDDEWAMAVVYHTAYLMALANFEYQVADRMYAMYMKKVQSHIVHLANNQPKMRPEYPPVILPDVRMPDE